MTDSTWHELAIETAMVVHVEQIVGGVAVECDCGAEAVLFITTEPDMEPGPCCASCAHNWIGLAFDLLRKLFPPDGAPGGLT